MILNQMDGLATCSIHPYRRDEDRVHDSRINGRTLRALL